MNVYPPLHPATTVTTARVNHRPQFIRQLCPLLPHVERDLLLEHDPLADSLTFHHRRFEDVPMAVTSAYRGRACTWRTIKPVIGDGLRSLLLLCSWTRSRLLLPPATWVWVMVVPNFWYHLLVSL